MNQLKAILLSAAMLTGALSSYVLTHSDAAAAGANDGLMMAVTPYVPNQSLDFFFQNSVHPLKNVEDSSETPVFISMITASQKDAYTSAGYKPVIVDANPGDFERYAVLFRRDRNDRTPLKIVQTDTLKSQGIELAYTLDNEKTLVRFAPGKSLGQVALVNAQIAGVKARVFHGDMVAPEGRVSSAVYARFGPASSNAAVLPAAAAPTPTVITWLLRVLLATVVGVLVYALLYRSKYFR